MAEEKESKKSSQKASSNKQNKKSQSPDAVESKDSSYHGDQEVNKNLSDADAYAEHPKFQKFKK